MGIFRGTGGTGDSTTDTTVTTVTEKAAEAASSATSAANSATSAANSASSASTSEANAATSESNAATSATASATSATASETAKTASQAAQTAAETAEANAETAEANAVTAKNQAESARDNAQTAQTAAETAETNAETAYADTLAIYGSTTDVQNAVNSASASATTATTKAAEAATSATNAANSATSAGTSETNAASSASQAATSANTAGSHATDAETAKNAAETAQAAAEAAEANINGLYLGSLADDPTLDGNGLAVGTGDLYFNTTENEVRVYTDNDEWIAVIEAGGDATFNSLTSNNDVVVKGNLEVQGTTITVDSATAQTIDLGDNDKIRFGDSDDLQIYHDGTDSYIANTTGTLKLSGNTDVTGNITVSGTVDGRDIAADGTTLDAVASTYVDVSGDTLTGDLAFGDSVKAKFGGGNDLRIYHDGAKSVIEDQGSGALQIRGTDLKLRSSALEEYIECIANGAVTLYYDNASKLATTSSGIDVTGTVVADGGTIVSSGADAFSSKAVGGYAIQAYQDATSAGHTALDLRSDATSGTRYLIRGYNDAAGTPTEVFSVSADGTVTADGLNLAAGSNISSLGGLTLTLDSDNSSTNTYFEINADGTNKSIARFREDGDIYFYEDTGTTAKLTWDASAEELQFKDNVKAVFGDGGDLDIYHSATDTFILNRTGTLHIRNNSNDEDVRILTDDGSGGATDYFRADGSTGEAILYHYGSEKLATKSTGIDVTGTVVADGLTVDGSTNAVTLQSPGTNTRYYITDGTIQGRLGIDGGVDVHSGSQTAHPYRLRTSGIKRQELASNGDISFYDDAGTSQDFYWDASTSRLGLGTTSPAVTLEVNGGIRASATVSLYDTGSTGNYLSFVDSVWQGAIYHDSGDMYIRSGGTSSSQNRLRVRGNGDISFYDSSVTSEDFYWDASTSRLGLGTTSPGFKLDVQYGTDDFGARFYSSDATSYVSFQDNSTTNSTSVFCGASGDHFLANGKTALRFLVNVSEAMRINSSGNVGIGTTSPSEILHIQDGSSSGSFASNRQLIIEANGQAGIQISSTSTSGIEFGDTASATSGRILYQHDVDAMRLYTAGSEAARIDSSGRLGIGTTSPSTTLHVKHNGGGLRLQGESSDLYGAYLDFAKEAGTRRGLIGYTGSGTSMAIQNDESGDIRFNNNGSEAARIDSSGSFLVGKTAAGVANEGFEVNSNNYVAISKTSFSPLILSRKSTDGAIIDLRINNNTIGSIGNSGTLTYLDGNTGLIFKEGGTEAARIDSSGNLLVGKTATSYSTEGVNLTAGGHVTRSGDTVFAFNRTSSDGSIVNFAKDGTTVGSILSKGNGTNLAIVFRTEDNTDGCGIIGSGIGNGRILPADGNGDGIDNHIDLGTPTARWQDLYLSGGVYLGGTGADNLLDDYEEGTWTITFGPSSGFTPTSNTSTGYYTKKGREVTVTGLPQMTTPASLGTYVNNDANYALRVSGLPYAISNNISFRSAPVIGVLDDISVNSGYLAGHGDSGGSSVSIYQSKDNGGTRTSPTLSTSRSCNFHFCFTYFTDS